MNHPRYEATHDPETYNAMAAPYQSSEDAQAAYVAFMADVSEARRRHRITDVHVIAKMRIKNGDGMASAHIGAQLEAVHMCAYAYGIQRKKLETLLQEACAGHIYESDSEDRSNISRGGQ